MGEELTPEELGIREVETTFTITATFPANLPANNKVYASIQVDPAIVAEARVTVPADEAWVVEDLYVMASQPVDAILEFFKNLTLSMYKSAPINGLVVTNVARPIPTPFIYEGASMMTIQATNLAAIGASAVTITAYAKVRRFTPH
ncbi:MAG: hypothetical protein QW290_09285 [Sulfolobales archaeon]